MRPGAYREPLAQGLRNLGDNAMADKVARGDIKFAISHSITGGVTRLTNLLPVFLKALASVAKQWPEEAAYYMRQLEDGQCVPVSSVGAVCFTGATQEEALAKQAAVIAAQPDQVYAPGELFMKS